MAKFEPKYDVNMSEVYRMRMTAAQKRALLSSTVGMGTVDFWREYDVYTAEQLEKLRAGAITADEFGSNIAKYVQEFMSATVEYPKDAKP